MRQTRRFLFLLTLLSVATFGKAQTSFDPEEGCLNVVEVSYAKGVGEYGDGGLSANYLHEKFITLFPSCRSLRIGLKICF